jgi:hypothetical protein
MNVQEVINITHERKNKLKVAINKIVESIHKKIIYYAKHKKESCIYIIPPMVDDYPVYDRMTVTKDIYKILNDEGYIVSAFANGQFDICWNEKLVQKKLSQDRYILQQEEKRLDKFSKKTKVINDRFSFLANPDKVINGELTLEEKLDQQVNKLLKQKDKEQKGLSKRIGNFSKI